MRYVQFLDRLFAMDCCFCSAMRRYFLCLVSATVFSVLRLFCCIIFLISSTPNAAPGIGFNRLLDDLIGPRQELISYDISLGLGWG